MTVLVTGGGGFLGSHVVDLLRSRGISPRIMVRPGEAIPNRADGMEVCSADLCEPASLRPALRGVKQVIHCAAKTGPWGPDAEYHRVNVAGLEALAKGALQAGAESFVHVSSITVHGNNISGIANENSPFRAEPNPYSRSKIEGEGLLQVMIRDHKAPITIVRPGWIYGPRDAASFARFARKIETGRMAIIGGGHNQLPLIYVADAAAGILLASAHDSAKGRVYLLVNDERATQLDFLTGIAKQLGVPAPRRRVPYGVARVFATGIEALAHMSKWPDPPVSRYGIDLLGGDNHFQIARARNELGFVPCVSLAEGLRRSVDWYRSVHEAPGPPKAA